ncbi:MAG: HEPN domain-containing protein [Candidatus Poribacteria bacterium]|nr:HEPN domain-containing protein [Candidatus Poribacteria bacterium]
MKEAKVLLDHGCAPGAYYLLGYAVECALKACIAKKTRRYDFPDRKRVNDNYTHDLDKLLTVANLKDELERERQSNPNLEDNWTIVREWSEQSRYDDAISISDAQELYSACTGRRTGVLS